MAENSTATNKNLGASSTTTETDIKVVPDVSFHSWIVNMTLKNSNFENTNLQSGLLVQKDDKINSAPARRGVRTKQTARKTCGGPGASESIQRMQLMSLLKADPEN